MIATLAAWIERNHVSRLEIACVFALALVLVVWTLSPRGES